MHGVKCGRDMVDKLLAILLAGVAVDLLAGDISMLMSFSHDWFQSQLQWQ